MKIFTEPVPVEPPKVEWDFEANFVVICSDRYTSEIAGALFVTEFGAQKWIDAMLTTFHHYQHVKYRIERIVK